MTGFRVSSDGCAGFTLTANGGATCTIVVTYGPVASAQADTTGLINVAYKPNSASASVNAFATQEVQAQTAALISVANIAVTGMTGGSGNGTSGTPYQFYNSAYSGTPIIFTFTYQNTGTASATNFAVNLNNLPVGYAISGTPTCGDGISPATSTLAASATCTVAVSAISPSALWNPYSYSGALNVNIPGYSYTDTNTGFNSNTAPIWSGHYANSNTIYVTANPFAVVSSNSATHTTAAAGGTYNVTYTSSAGDSAEYGGSGVTVTIPPTSLTNSSSDIMRLLPSKFL